MIGRSSTAFLNEASLAASAGGAGTSTVDATSSAHSPIASGGAGLAAAAGTTTPGGTSAAVMSTAGISAYRSGGGPVTADSVHTAMPTAKTSPSTSAVLAATRAAREPGGGRPGAGGCAGCWFEGGKWPVVIVSRCGRRAVAAASSRWD